MRLAGVLALLHWSEQDGMVPPVSIDRERLRHAILLWNSYFHQHADAVFCQAGRPDRDREARRVVR